MLPESTDELLMVRPVGGLDEEIVGILPAVEPVESATFPLPTAEDLGDFPSGRLLRDAARLSTRAAAGPFRSFGRIAVEPRPYQLVPLMMALKLDPVRLLIADDVGIGKTIEAASSHANSGSRRDPAAGRAVSAAPRGTVAEELRRSSTSTPSWSSAAPSSAGARSADRRLGLRPTPFTVVSTDFIKTPRRAEDFVLKCPEFVIVDEAHGCTLAGGVGRGRQQRFDFCNDRRGHDRHLVLVTATPHSGNEEAFRSLLSLLDPEFADLPTDLDRPNARRPPQAGPAPGPAAPGRHPPLPGNRHAFPEAQGQRGDLHVQPGVPRALRRHPDIRARVRVRGDDGQRRRRVRYWSALALLRCVSSSPAAAAATLRSRAAVDEAEDEEVDEVGRRTVLDQDDADEPWRSTSVRDRTRRAVSETHSPQAAGVRPSRRRPSG